MRIIVCLVLFAIVMLALKFAIGWSVDNIGGWTALAAIGVFLAIARWLDKRDQRAEF